MPHVPGTVPYAWPFDGRLAPGRTSLVVLGAQDGLVGASCDADRVLRVIGTLAPAMRAWGALVVWVRHSPVPGSSVPRAAALLSGAGDLTAGLVEPGDLVIEAAGWDGCFGSSLDATLRRRADASVLCGFATELTVDSTVRTLNDRGHECLVLTDACAPVDPDLGRHAHHSLTMSGGIFGALGTSSDLLAALGAATLPGVPS